LRKWIQVSGQGMWGGAKENLKREEGEIIKKESGK
jgi:hypothetical protein